MKHTIYREPVDRKVKPEIGVLSEHSSEYTGDKYSGKEEVMLNRRHYMANAELFNVDLERELFTLTWLSAKYELKD